MVFGFTFWYVFVSIFVVGAICGSFLNCVIWRAYANESAAKGRSYCPKCRHQLSWTDLVPLFSFLVLRGRCRYCKNPISPQYPLVEAVTGLVFVAAAWHFYPGIFYFDFSFLKLAEIAAYWALISALTVIFVADLRWYFIPDGAVISGLAAAVFLRLVQVAQNSASIQEFDPEIIVNPLLSSLLAGSFFLAIFMFSRGTWMGFGDVKYAFLMGLVLGFPDVALGLFLAFFFGAILGLALVARREKKMSSQVPFGPFLVAGTAAALFFSDPIIDWYLALNFNI
jgi:prepilin signal peptidase PulO-like enzyme (type II secretory pathway)